MGAALAHSLPQTQTLATSRKCLTMYRKNPNRFLRRFTNIDEPWNHHNTPKPRNNKNNGSLQVNGHPKRPTCVFQPIKLLQPLFGVYKASTTSITSIKVKPSPAIIIQSFRKKHKLICSKFDPNKEG